MENIEKLNLSEEIKWKKSTKVRKM